MRVIIYIQIFIVCAMLSCSTKNNTEIIELDNVLLLDSAEVIYEFDDKFPISLMKKDSLLYVIQAKSDTCLSIINLKTNRILTSFGTVGHGDTDLLNPNFILSVCYNDLLLDVGNLRRIVKVEYQESNNVIMDDWEYPDSVFMASEMNFSENYIVGRKVDAYDSNMFFIYNRNQNSMKSVPCFPEISFPLMDYNYTYASVLALNETKGKIISGMYFFDMFHIYDLFGNRLSTYRFSDDYYPSINRQSGRIDFKKGYSGIVRVYPTQDYCYLLRIKNGLENDSPQYTLVKIDWDGNINKSYSFVDNILGQFCVDESDNKAYMINNYINDEGEDIYAIVSYQLE